MYCFRFTDIFLQLYIDWYVEFFQLNFNSFVVFFSLETQKFYFPSLCVLGWIDFMPMHILLTLKTNIFMLKLIIIDKNQKHNFFQTIYENSRVVL